MLTMEMPLNDRGLENHYEARVVRMPHDRNLRQVRVNSRSIDSLLFELNYNISFLKIDTEGYELPCIKGALRTIKKWKPALLIEVSTDLNDTESEAFQCKTLLKDYGYDLWWFDGKKLHQRQIGDTSINYFFLTPKHVELLKKHGTLF